MIPCTKILLGLSNIHNAAGAGPLVVWNITNKCNLKCRHCYRDSSALEPEMGLSNQKTVQLINEIKKLKPPIVLLTGGEPLLKKDIFDIVKGCRAAGLRVGLSTNGTLIDKSMAKKIKASGIDYVGISIDGRKNFHDKFRGMKGAFDLSWAAIKYLNILGIKTGVRFTLTNRNKDDLLYVLDKTFKSGTKRFCLYHLVYSGRATLAMDILPEEKRKIMHNFFSKVKNLCLIDENFEVLTVDNPADAVFMSESLINKKAALNCIKTQAGCPAGDRIVYLDYTGEVYPCQFLREESLGNIKQRPLFDIYNDSRNPLLNRLRNKATFLKGRCGSCAYKEICAGCRARAKSYSGSLWSEDPACYLT